MTLLVFMAPVARVALVVLSYCTGGLDGPYAPVGPDGPEGHGGSESVSDGNCKLLLNYRILQLLELALDQIGYLANFFCNVEQMWGFRLKIDEAGSADLAHSLLSSFVLKVKSSQFCCPRFLYFRPFCLGEFIQEGEIFHAFVNCLVSMIVSMCHAACGWIEKRNTKAGGALKQCC